MFATALFLLLVTRVAALQTPVVIVHGILSTDDDLQDARFWFLQNLNRPILTIEIGNGRLDSVFKPMNWQVERLRETIDSIDHLQEPFHMIGFSQGGLLARAFAETSNRQRVKTLMTFGTPHMGVYYYSDEEIYSPLNQNRLSYSNYWKDPYMFPLYLKNSTFLPSLNGEVESSLRLNDKVDEFVMVWSPNDEVIRPIESGKYEFYEQNTESVVPFLKSEMFKNDYIGIRRMFEEDRVHFVQTDCAHREFKSVDCLERHKNKILEFLL
jgi:palmitoyl-protein thioesterase